MYSNSGTNTYICGSSDALCSRCVRSCAIPNSFALYDRDVIRGWYANKAECH